MSMAKRSKPGRSLEKVIAAIERAIGHRSDVKVTSPAHLPDRVTGQPREHDVLLEIAAAHRTIRVALECRDRSRKITVNDVEGFSEKCRDTTVDRGVIVSPKGFSKTALLKASRKGIECQSLSKVDAFDWLAIPGIVQIEREGLRFDFFFGIEPTPGSTIPSRYEMRDGNGNALNIEVLKAPTLAEIEKRQARESNIEETGPQKHVVHFSKTDITVVDLDSGQSLPVATMTATVSYTASAKVLPFSLVQYADAVSGQVTTDAAIADVNIGDVSGKVVIVMKPGEGGGIFWTTNGSLPKP